MKSLLFFVIFIKSLKSAYHNQYEFESFFIFKCMVYLSVSSIHSEIVSIPIPLGALIMFIFHLLDSSNQRIKLKLIGSGLLIILISIISFENLSSPIQKLYLYSASHDTQKINVYSHTPYNDTYLFSVTATEDISDWVKIIQSSSSASQWNTKCIPTDVSYRIELQLSNEIVNILLSSNSILSPNLFVGEQYYPFSNSELINLIYKYHPDTPNVLTINSGNNTSINITNPTMLKILYKNIVWGEKEPLTNYDESLFTIPAYLFFDANLGCKLFLSNTFEYAYIQNQGVIRLSDYLSNMLGEQFILSQLDPISSFDLFDLSKDSSDTSNNVNYFIEPDEAGVYFALYKRDFKTNEKILLHTVTSSDAEFFLLKNPYILLLDERSPGQSFLMLVNQNIPEKHRYIEKNQPIIRESISVCPQNTKFTYIISQQDSSSLYYVNNYYQSPKLIASGSIDECLFISTENIVFTQRFEEDNILCIYNTSSSKIVKYIIVPGDIKLIESKDDKVYFTVQKMEGVELKQGLFYIDNNLDLKKVIKE